MFPSSNSDKNHNEKESVEVTESAQECTSKPLSEPNSEPDTGAASASLSEPISSKSNLPAVTKTYRCKKCRKIVASQNNILIHPVGSGSKAFNYRKIKNNYSASSDMECSSIFVEPMQWMINVKDGDLEGKLFCLNCSNRLGTFNWSGSQCSCGSWVTPAFQIHKNRVDEGY